MIFNALFKFSVLCSRSLTADLSFSGIAQLGDVHFEEDTSLERVLHLRGDALAKLMDDWTVDGTNAQEVQNKIEELFWTNVVIFGVGGWWGRKKSKTGKFKGDFFLYAYLLSIRPKDRADC